MIHEEISLKHFFQFLALVAILLIGEEHFVQLCGIYKLWALWQIYMLGSYRQVLVKFKDISRTSKRLLQFSRTISL